MKARPLLTPAQRSRRKQDLLLASALARNQALVAIGQIGQRVDLVVGSYRQVRAWMSVPAVSTATGVAASVAALLALRRVRSFRLLRWGVLSWRVCKLAIDLLPGWRAPR